MKTLDEMRADGDWITVFEEYAARCDLVLDAGGERTRVAGQGFGFDDVAEVLAACDGANDEADWAAVFRLRDGRFAHVAAGCDNTGWDCAQHGVALVAATLESLARWGVDRSNRERLGLGLLDAELDDEANGLPHAVCVARDSVAEDDADVRWTRVAGAWRAEVVRGEVSPRTVRLIAAALVAP